MGEIAATFRDVNPIHLVAFPLIVVAIIAIRGFRWQYLMKLIGMRYSMWRSAVVWSIGFAASSVTPAKVGDAIRAVYTNQETGRNFGECFLTVFIDRLMDLVTVVLYLIVAIVLFSVYYMQIPSIWLIFLATLGFFVLLWVIMNKNLMKKMIRPVFNSLFPKKHKEAMSISFNSFYDSLGVYVKEWKGTLNAFILTLVYWLMVFGMAWYVAFVLGLKVGVAYIFIIMPMVTLVELIPISVAGLGTREATVIYFFSIVGISNAQAVGFSLTYLIMGTYLTSLMGFIFWLRNPVKLGR